MSRNGKNKDMGDQGLASLPTHVKTVARGLLDFSQFLGLEDMMLVLGDEKSSEGDEDDIPLSAYKTECLRPSQRARDREFLESAKALAEGSRKLEGGIDQDINLWGLFRHVLEARIDDAHCSDSYLPNMIAYTANVAAWDNDLDPSRISSTSPNPDFYVGFPVHDAEDPKVAVFKNDPSLQNFTFDMLSQLATKGLSPVPLCRLLTKLGKRRTEIEKLRFPLLCFPWCIFQLKEVPRLASSEEIDTLSSKTCLQASMAASGALAMLEKLARFADMKQYGQHIPPVVTITSVGQNTTVWLAFFDIVDEKYRDHKMLSIWHGRINKIWDAIQFCRILDNLLVWSQHILRPKVSHYIDQWRLRYCPEVQNVYSQLERDCETAELVYRIQDRLSSLNISPNSNLPELIQQAVILQEVMRSIPSTPESAPQGHLDPNAKMETERRPETSKPVPSHPKTTSSTVGASGDAVAEKEEKDSGEYKDGEDDKEEDNFSVDNRGNDKYYSARSRDKPTPRRSSPENDMSAPADVSVSCEKTASPTTIKNEQVSAVPSKRPGEPMSKSDLPTDSSVDKKLNGKPSFSYSYEFKTSDFEPNPEQYVSDSLKSNNAGLNSKEKQSSLIASRIANGYMLSLRMRRVCQTTYSHKHPSARMPYQRSFPVSKNHASSEDLASKGVSSNLSGSNGTPSIPTNPFTTASFELSFDNKPFLSDMSVTDPWYRVERTSKRRFANPAQSTSGNEVDEADDSSFLRRTTQSKPANRKRPEPQLARIPNPPLSVKILWKDGKSIVVRLPPAMPQAPFDFQSPAGTPWV